MKIIQEIIYAVVLAHVFFEWYRKDQEESEQEMNQSFKSNVLNNLPFIWEIFFLSFHVR